MLGVGQRMVPQSSLPLIRQKNKDMVLIVREEIFSAISEAMGEEVEATTEVSEAARDQAGVMVGASEVTTEEAEQTTVVFTRKATIERKAFQSANKI